MSEIFLRLTGGRPMRKIGYLFTDMVSGESVYEFADYRNRHWMAYSKWSFFRVRMKPSSR